MILRDDERYDRDRRQDDERNQTAMLTVLLVVAVALTFASTMPAGLVAPALANYLFFGALGAALVALFRGEGFRESYLSGWDQCLTLLLLSLAARFFVDPAAVGELVAEYENGTAAPLDG